MDNTRNWDPTKGKLEPWLKDQIKSEIDTLVKSASHRREMPLPDRQSSEAVLDKIEKGAVELGIFSNPRPPNPETAILEQEETKQRNRKINAIFQAVEGETELEQVLEAIMDGCEPKTRFLAEHLKVSSKDVNNRLRRLRRRAVNIIKKEAQ